jgi:Yersinia/Haemophilus virulence surface antigen
MPYYFTCPQCKKPNYGFKSAPGVKPGGGMSYFDDENCTYCGAKGLYWVGEQSHAERLTAQLKVPAAQIAVGVGTSPIEWFDPLGQKDVRPEVVDLLRGVATLDASFSQGQRREGLIPGRIDVKQGLCEGLSLHWIRRVLQGGSTTYQVGEEKKSVPRDDAERLKHLKRQMETGANVHRKVQPEVLTSWREKVLTSEGFTKKVVRDPATNKDTTKWVFPPGDKQQVWDRLQAEYPPEYWEELRKNLDMGALNVGGRQSRRPFSNVAVVSSTAQIEQGLSAFASTLCDNARMKPGRAALLSVGLTSGSGEAGGSIAGHAIAAYCRGDNECYLFDPNIGNFRCKSRDNLREAIVTLITAWETKMKWKLGGKYGYSLFERRETLAAVKPREIPVVTTPSPTATAQQNPLAIPRPIDSPAKVPTQAPLVAAAGRPGGVMAHRAAAPGGSGALKATPPVATSAAVKPAIPKPSSPATGGQQFRPQDPPKTIASTSTGPSGTKSKIAQWEQRAQAEKK